MLYKIIAVSLIFTVVLFYLKSTASDYFVPTLILSGLIILSFLVEYLVNFFVFFKEIQSLSGIDSQIFTLIFKIIAISYLIEFCSGIISDAGLNSLADKVVLGGKIIVLCMVLPIIKQIITILISLL